MKTILLKFSGPLQSWGTTSNFETRQTDRYPSKSGIIGILAASLGLKRDNDKAIQKLTELDVAIRIDQPGELLKDYHIARKYKNNSTFDRTYVTQRYYLEDAIFVVGLASSDHELINNLEYALKNPYYQPYLGRRSNPLTADFFIGVKNQELLTAMTELEWQAADWYKRENTVNNLELIIESHLVESNQKKYVKDAPTSFSQKHRKFNFRSISRELVYINNETKVTEHNIFDSF